MPVVRNPQFYFREGLCWILTLNEYSEYLKARLKGATVNDVNAMALYPFEDCDDYLLYFITVINSYFIFHYKRTFISGNSAFQINDARQLPIIIPTEEQLSKAKDLASKAILLKKSNMLDDNSQDYIQSEVNELTNSVYFNQQDGEYQSTFNQIE